MTKREKRKFDKKKDRERRVNKIIQARRNQPVEKIVEEEKPKIEPIVRSNGPTRKDIKRDAKIKERIKRNTEILKALKEEYEKEIEKDISKISVVKSPLIEESKISK